MTPEEERTVRYIASELYALAAIGRHDLDGTFVSVRREFLSTLAARLMATVPAAPEKASHHR